MQRNVYCQETKHRLSCSRVLTSILEFTCLNLLRGGHPCFCFQVVNADVLQDAHIIIIHAVRVCNKDLHTD